MIIIKRFRYYFRLSSSFVKKRQKIILLGMFLGTIFFYFLPKMFYFLGSRQTIKIGLVGKYNSQELPLEIQYLISSGLTKIASEGSVVPSLAESWQIENEGKDYIFTLKDGLFWQKNVPLVSKDINYNFNDVAVEHPDNRTVVFHLRQAFSPFLSIVSRPIFKNNLNGIGEYQVRSTVKRNQIVEKIVLKPKSFSNPIYIYRFYPTEESLITAFKLGEVNRIEKISQTSDLEKISNLKIESSVENSRYVAVFFNNQDQSLEDKSLRQSLAYAIKKPWENRALSPINPESWAYNSGVKPYIYDLENAKTLFNKSQEKKGESNFKKIELKTIPSLLSTAEGIAKDWRKLGIEVEVKIFNGLSNDFQALLFTQEIPSDPDQYTFWHTTQAQVSNICRIKNPKIDKLLEDGRKTSDLEKRKEIYFDFQRFIVEESPAVFLYHPVLYTVERQ